MTTPPPPTPKDPHAEPSEEFGRYISHLTQGMRRLDQRMGLAAYCAGLMLPLARKCVGPMAARLDPQRADSRHQSLHHFIAKAEWSDEGLLALVAEWVTPMMDFGGSTWLVVDDIGFPKRGNHSVGVTRQRYGAHGKRDNSQVAVNVWQANERVSLPLAWQLYLPKHWADNAVGRLKAGVPEEIRFATKPQIALQQLRRLMFEGIERNCVWADIEYGVDPAFRRGLDDLGLHYMAGVGANTLVGSSALNGAQLMSDAEVLGSSGDSGTAERRITVKTLANSLPESAFQEYTGLSQLADLAGFRFATVRVRAAVGRSQLLPTQWLVVECHRNPAQGRRYYLSSLPASAQPEQLVRSACIRFRVQRDTSDLLQATGLGHYEGRGWRGFHHHASVSIAAYGFLLTQRLRRMHRGLPDQYTLPGLAKPEDETLAKAYRDAIERGAIESLRQALLQLNSRPR